MFGNAEEVGDEELAGASPLAMNVLIDGKGAVRRRPGLATYAEAPSASFSSYPINGLFVTSNNDTLLAVANNPAERPIYRCENFSATEINATSQGRLPGTGRPVFTETEQYTFIAGGAAPQQVDTVGATSQRLGIASTAPPPFSTHIVSHASRLLSNDLTSTSTRQFVRYSTLGVTGVGQWDQRRFFSVDASPDAVVALHVGQNEVFAFGQKTLQTYVSDPSYIYAPTKPIDQGCSAPYSIISTDGNFAWLNHRRRFVVSDGRSSQDISAAIGTSLDELTTTSDCYGYRLKADQFDCLVWSFPTDGRTYCWQQGGGWSQWASWTAPSFTPFTVTSSVFRQSDNVNVVGTSDGRVGKFSVGSGVDFLTILKSDVKTGFYNRGTDARKWCKRLRLSFRRGAASSSSAVVSVSWRDDLGQFSTPIEYTIGTAGDYDPVVEVFSPGVYRRRQWRLEFNSGDEFVLASALETFDVVED